MQRGREELLHTQDSPRQYWCLTFVDRSWVVKLGSGEMGMDVEGGICEMSKKSWCGDSILSKDDG